MDRVPGALFISYLGTGVLRDVELSGREVVYCWASLVLAPAAQLLGFLAPLLVWPRRRPDAATVIGWANAVVLVVGTAFVLSAPTPG